jgi:hypothetical protein
MLNIAENTPLITCHSMHAALLDTKMTISLAKKNNGSFVDEFFGSNLK